MASGLWLFKFLNSKPITEYEMSSGCRDTQLPPQVPTPFLVGFHSVHLSIYLYMYIYLSIHPSVFQSVCLSIQASCLDLSPSVIYLSIYLAIYLSFRLYATVDGQILPHFYMLTCNKPRAPLFNIGRKLRSRCTNGHNLAPPRSSWMPI